MSMEINLIKDPKNAKRILDAVAEAVKTPNFKIIQHTEYPDGFGTETQYFDVYNANGQLIFTVIECNVKMNGFNYILPPDLCKPLNTLCKQHAVPKNNTTNTVIELALKYLNTKTK